MSVTKRSAGVAGVIGRQNLNDEELVNETNVRKATLFVLIILAYSCV